MVNTIIRKIIQVGDSIGITVPLRSGLVVGDYIKVDWEVVSIDEIQTIVCPICQTPYFVRITTQGINNECPACSDGARKEGGMNECKQV
jgi:hypothetical protein